MNFNDYTTETEEISLCITCHEQAGSPTIVDFPDGFARCEKCGLTDDDTDLVAVKREDAQ